MWNNSLNHFPVAGTYIFPCVTVIKNTSRDISECGVFSTLRPPLSRWSVAYAAHVKSPSLTSLLVTEV